MRCKTAQTLVDAYWLVAIEAHGDLARDAQPPSTRERLANQSHRDRCQSFVDDLKISASTATLAIGLEVSPCRHS